MSDNGYDIWRDVANILVNPTIKNHDGTGYRVPTKALISSLQKPWAKDNDKDRFFEYYNPELAGGRKKKDDSAAAAPAAAASAAGDEDKKKAETSSFCNQKSFKFADLKYHFDRQTNFRDDNDNFWSFVPLIHKIKNKDPTQVDIETYIRISKFFQKTTEDKLDDDVHSFSGWCREKYDAIYYYCNETSEKLEALGAERRLYTKKHKQDFINNDKNFPEPMRANIMKVADLIRVLNFFVLDMGYLYEMITPLGGPHQPKELPYITQMKPPAFQIFIDLLEMIDNIDGYGPEIGLVKTFDAAKVKFESDRAAFRAEKSKSSAAAVPPAPSAAAAAAPAPTDAKHYSQRRPKSNRKKPGTFKIDPATMAALKRRKSGAKTAIVGATVRGKCPFCFQDVTTAQKRIKVDGIYYHQHCYEAQEQGWKSRESRSQPGRALYRNSGLSIKERWNPPKKEGDKYVGGRKTKRKKKKQTKRYKKKQKRRKTNKRKKKKKSKKRRK